MLCLGRKYGIKHLAQEAIERLHVDFPTSLQAWDEHFHGQLSRSFRLVDCEDENAYTEVINLTHKYNITAVLPAVYASYLLKYSLVSLRLSTSSNNFRSFIAFNRRIC
jgi:hypothetical protein